MKTIQNQKKLLPVCLLLLSFAILNQTATAETGGFKKIGGSLKEATTALTAPTLTHLGNELRQQHASGNLNKLENGFYEPLPNGDYSFGFDSGNGNVGVVWELTPENALTKYNELSRKGRKRERFVKKYDDSLPEDYINSTELLAAGTVEYYANIWTGETYTPHSISLYMHEDKAWVEVVFFNSINERVKYPGVLNRSFREKQRLADTASQKKKKGLADAEAAAEYQNAEKQRIAGINKKVQTICSAQQWKGPALYYKDTTGLRLMYSLLNEGETVSEKIGEVITLTEADPRQVWWEVFQVGNNFALIKAASRNPVYNYNAEEQKLFDEGLYMIQDSPENISQLLEAQRINGYYFLAGIQRYSTGLGIEKGVPCLLRVNIPE
ncbi:hypothetical protein ACFLQY_03470 [Verrucomicrobiota bacterium]